MATKKTVKKPSAKMLSAGKDPKRGTVRWLIKELQKFPPDSPVLHGDHDEAYYEPTCVEVLSIKEGYINEERGEKLVCIRAW